MPTTFPFSTHNLLAPSYQACGQHLDCVDSDLLMLHTKCLDETLWLDPQLADRDRARGNHSVGALRDYFRHRCGDVERWARTPCELAPSGAPYGSGACASVHQSFGIRPGNVPVLPIPAWAARQY